MPQSSCCRGQRAAIDFLVPIFVKVVFSCCLQSGFLLLQASPLEHHFMVYRISREYHPPIPWNTFLFLHETALFSLKNRGSYPLKLKEPRGATPLTLSAKLILGFWLAVLEWELLCCSWTTRVLFCKCSSGRVLSPTILESPIRGMKLSAEVFLFRVLDFLEKNQPSKKKISLKCSFLWKKKSATRTYSS